MNLNGKVVLITGASRGLGSYIARAIARRRVQLALIARSQPGLDEVARSVGPERTLTVAADLTRMEEIHTAFDATMERFGRIDVLINNAGMTNGTDFLHTSPEALAQTVDLNLRATVVMTRLVAEVMARQHAGHILSVSSLAGVASMPGEATYSATKSALRLFTASLRKELVSQGIRLTDLTIGPMSTELLDTLESNRYVHGMFANGRRFGFFADLEPERVARAAVRGIEREEDVVVLPRRARYFFLPFQGLTRTVSQWMTPI
jgi:short-subunit dehydrogenase